MTGPRGARCTGAGEGPPVRTRRFRKRGPGLSRGVKALASAAVERREALRTDRKVRAAPRKRGFYSSRLSALRSLSFWGELIKLGRGCVARALALIRRRDLTLLNAAASIRHQQEAPEFIGGKARSGARQ